MRGQPVATVLATLYADQVMRVLWREAGHLLEGSLTDLVHEEVVRQAITPKSGFEVIVTYSQEWRLMPDFGNLDKSRWRAMLACFKDRPTVADQQLEARVNAELRAIVI